MRYKQILEIIEELTPDDRDKFNKINPTSIDVVRLFGYQMNVAYCPDEDKYSIYQLSDKFGRPCMNYSEEQIKLLFLWDQKHKEIITPLNP